MTINELAKELGISKQATTKKIKALGLFDKLEKSGNRYVVPDEVVDAVRQQNANQPPTKTDELAFLREQIEKKDAQIAALQDALEREQQLHAVDKQQLLLLSAPKERRGLFSFFKHKKSE